MSKSSSLVVLVVTLLISRGASASTDINGLFDARSHGMGGTGVAFIGSPGAIPINPANLDKINKYSVSLDIYGIAAQPQGVYSIWHEDADGNPYQSYDTIRSKTKAAPIPFLGGAYRLHRRLVLGLAFYPVIGQGTKATYHPAPEAYPDLLATNDVAMFLLETGEALSIRLLDNLSIALMWRITYMSQSVSTPFATTLPGPPGVVTNPDKTEVKNINMNVSGVNFTGFQFGVHYQPVPSLELGFTYRAKVEVWGSGYTTTEIGGMTNKLPTESGFNNPHSLRGGLAWSAFDKKLLLAMDFKYLFYADAFKTSKVVIERNGEKMTQYRDLNWKDSAVLQLGAEYQVIKPLALRAGYTVLNSATRPDYAIAMAAPPGISHLICGGIGFKAMDSLDIDLAGSYVVLEGVVTTKTPTNDGPGTYASHGGMVSLSAAFHK